ncbi:ribokinase [Pigmentiphaga litoralis]|uniref:PfkB family carbohydrate kinase n=1 Tax=Pigmentiphaga litoralis TaxID=516702 RepID=UPI0019A04004|nr:PfkB family carbohydrate kinase [Pigmentiphaga litoralis]GGX33551.1 ribokinase [Pigmentiphaga litoralis]
MKPTLLSLGSVNADFQMRTDDAIGSLETALASDFRRLPGGKAANTAYLGALFGHRSCLFGRVGDDDLASQVLDPLRAAGVDTTGVTAAAGAGTAVSFIMVPPDAKKTIVLAANANDVWDEAAVRAMTDIIARTPAPACLVVDYEVPAWVVARAIDSASSRGMPVVLDPSFPDRLDRGLLCRITALTPNLDEAQAVVGRTLDGIDDAARAARELCKEGVGIVCFKLPDGGCVWADRDHAMHVPPGEVKPVDTTGAGDAFTGVLAIALLEGRSPAEAAAWGVAAANLAVTGYGSQAAYAPRDEVLKMAGDLFVRATPLDA